MYVLKRTPIFFLAVAILIANISFLSSPLTVLAAEPAFGLNAVWSDYDPANHKHYYVDAALSSSDPAARRFHTLREAANFLSLDPLDGGPTESEVIVFVADGVYDASIRFTQQYSRLGLDGYPNPRYGYSAVTSLAIIGQSREGAVIDGGFTAAGERVSLLEDGVCGIGIFGKRITVKNLTVQNVIPGDGTGQTGSYNNIAYCLQLYPLDNLTPVHIENCDFRYTSETRFAALNVWGMGIAIDDPTSGKYFGDKSNASVTVKRCDFNFLNTGIWLEENRGEILIENNNFNNILPYGTSPGRGVRLYNQVHPSYTAATGPGAGGAPLEYGTQVIRDCRFNLAYGGCAVMCDIGTPSPSGGTSRSLVAVEALVAQDNTVNIIKGEDAVYAAIPPSFKPESTAFAVRSLETNPLYMNAPSIDRVEIDGNMVSVSAGAMHSGFYSGQMLNGVNIAGSLNRIDRYGDIRINHNTFQGLTSSVAVTEYAGVPGTVNADYVDATHNLHYGSSGKLIDEYRPLEGQYVTITGSDQRQFNLESYEPFYVAAQKSELSFEEFFILDIYDASSNQRIQSSYSFDKNVKDYLIDDLDADVNDIYFIAWKVEKGTKARLTHLESETEQYLEDDGDMLPIPSRVYPLTLATAAAQPSGVDTFVFDLSTVNENPYKDESNRNRYTIRIVRKAPILPPGPDLKPDPIPDPDPVPEPVPEPLPPPVPDPEVERPKPTPPPPNPPGLLPPPTSPIDPETIDPDDPPRYRDPIPEEMIPEGWRQVRVVVDNGEAYYTIIENEIPLVSNPSTGSSARLRLSCLFVSALALGGYAVTVRKPR